MGDSSSFRNHQLEQTDFLSSSRAAEEQRLHHLTPCIRPSPCWPSSWSWLLLPTELHQCWTPVWPRTGIKTVTSTLRCFVQRRGMSWIVGAGAVARQRCRCHLKDGLSWIVRGAKADTSRRIASKTAAVTSRTHLMEKRMTASKCAASRARPNENRLSGKFCAISL